MSARTRMYLSTHDTLPTMVGRTRPHRMAKAPIPYHQGCCHGHTPKAKA